jgi:hypothetical protein
MRSRRTIVGVLLLVVGVLLLGAALLTGRGGSRSADRKAIDAKFEMADFKIASLETRWSEYNEPPFEEATRNYIALVREYADVLGPGEVKRRLAKKGVELSSFCAPCVGLLDDEARKY